MTSSKSVNRRSSIRVQWVFRFAGNGTADVIWYDRFRVMVDCVRIHGSCVSSKEAKKYAIDAKAGKPIPSWVEAFAEAAS